MAYSEYGILSMHKSRDLQFKIRMIYEFADFSLINLKEPVSKMLCRESFGSHCFRKSKLVLALVRHLLAENAMGNAEETNHTFHILLPFNIMKYYMRSSTLEAFYPGGRLFRAIRSKMCAS